MKNRRISPLLAPAFGVLLQNAAFGEPLRIVLPAETPSFRAGPGVELAMAQCLQCHSSEYITTQPPLTRAAWKASIEKMRGKYGAVVPPETEAALLEYLAGTSGPAPGSTPRK